MKKILSTAVLLAFCFHAYSQSGINSPYSQYGFGSLSDKVTGFNVGMNGLGQGSREGNQVNSLNPASYSSIDSLTFIFDVGMSGQLTNFDENGKRKNAKNASFDYAIGSFRAFKNVGIGFGLLPFSRLGYSYQGTYEVNDANSTTYTNTYTGEGGFREVFLGIGWQIFKGFSVGVNGGYLWGDYNKSIVNSYSDQYVNTLSKYYSANVNSYKVDFGTQISIPFSKKDRLTIGATYGLGNKLGADPECKVISTNSQTTVSDTASYVVENGLKLPVTIGGGLMFSHQDKWRVGADVLLQKWADVSFPEYGVVNGSPAYLATDGYFKDRKKITVGGEFCANKNSRKFLDRVRFRAGASYTTPYLIINGQDGPKEISVSAGVGIPLINVWNNRSILNVSGQWVRMDAANLIKENTFRINIGITFNERWFMKWKVE